MKRVLHLLFALAALQVVTTTGCNCGRYDDEFNRVCDSLCDSDAGARGGGTAGGASGGSVAGGSVAGGSVAGGASAGGTAGGSVGGGVVAGGAAAGGLAGGDAGGEAGGVASAGGFVTAGGLGSAGGFASAGGSAGGASGGGVASDGGNTAGGFVVGGGIPVGGGFVIGGGIPVGGGFIVGGGSATDGGSVACAMDTEPCDLRTCCTGLRCIPSANGSFCRSTTIDAGVCAGQGASCLAAIPCCDGLSCGTTTTCQPTARDGGMCLADNASCTTSSACCNGCCNGAGICSTIGGACVVSAPYQCQNAGSFCNPEAPSRRCCMPPLIPALQCLQPAGQACATGADCCSGCCQGRPGIGLCTPGSMVPDGTCQ